MNTTPPRPHPVPHPVLSAARATLNDPVPPVPSPTGDGVVQPPPTPSRDGLGRGHRTDTPETAKKHQTEHLLLAAKVAKITGDPHGTMAVLLGCPNCRPRSLS